MADPDGGAALSDGAAEPSAAALTFLFTDIVDSSRHWDAAPASMRVSLARHDELLHEIIRRWHGTVVKHTGDGVMAVFGSVVDAIDASVAAQLALSGTEWDTAGAVPLVVRMGIHTGEADSRAGDYFGMAVTHAARLMGVACGGQILVSEVSSRLASEAGLRPGRRLTEIGAVALKGVARTEHPTQVQCSGLQVDFPRQASAPSEQIGFVPVPMAAMIGRQPEIDRVVGLLEADRLVTIVGTGGVGKTRLAVEVATSMWSRCVDGVWWVDLAPAGSADSVVHTLSSALDVMATPNRDPLDGVIDSYVDREALVVLDNCEHVVAEVARLVRTLLQRCGRVRFLATSLVPIGLAAEQVVVLEPLAVDAQSSGGSSGGPSAAVRLFVERARAASGTFEADAATLETVAEICRRLDGVPLAIELAASKARSLGASQILTRLTDRFRLLDSSRRHDDDRHQSMTRVLEWSYDLLTPAAREVFDRLAVFPASFDLAAAESVATGGTVEAADVVDRVDELVDHSMLVADVGSSSPYRMFDMMREFGRLRLDVGGQRQAVEQRFVAHWVEFAGAARAGVRGREEAYWRDAVGAELNNLRAAHGLLLDAGDVDGALRLPVTLFEYAFFSLRPEIGDWAAAALAAEGAPDSPEWADATAVAAMLAWVKGDWSQAERHLAALDSAASATACYLPEFAHGLIAAFRSQPEQQLARYERCREIAEADGDAFRTALISGQVAFAKALLLRPEGTAAGEHAVELAESLGNPTALSTALWALGTAAMAPDPARALRCFSRSAELARAAGSTLNEVSAESSALGVHDRSRSALDELVYLRDRWEYWHRGGSTPVHWYVARKVALALMRSGQYRAAAVLFGAERKAQLSLPPSPGDARRIAEALDALRERIGADELDELMVVGAAMDHAERGRYVQEALQSAVAGLRISAAT